MNGKVRRGLVITSALLVAAIAIGVLFSQSDKREGIYKKLDIFVEVMQHIRRDYVEPVQTSAIFDGAIKGMMRGLDAESSYLTAAEYKQYLQDRPGRTASTGVEVVKHPGNGYVLVVYIRPDSPAANSGVEVGDFIRAIDGKSTRDLPKILIELLMAGPPDSVAAFSIVRTGMRRFLTFEIQRVELPQPEIAWKIIGGAGYIALPSFHLGALERVKSACAEFEGAGIEKVVIDIRGNLSGNLDEAIHVADLFVAGGKLLTLQAKDSSTDYSADDLAYGFNLFVLSDETTARAAEAFAVALADRKVATIVGRTTIGIGTVQKKIELEDGAMLEISYASAVGPDGTKINGAGVKPTVEVHKTSETKEGDAILEKALELAAQSEDAQEAAAA